MQRERGKVGRYVPVSDDVLRDSAAKVRRDKLVKYDTLPRTLPRTCDFCGHYEYVTNTVLRCGLNREPGEDCTCEAWTPRFRTDDPDERD